MNALDQAFIKAFNQQPDTTAKPALRQMPAKAEESCVDMDMLEDSSASAATESRANDAKSSSHKASRKKGSTRAAKVLPIASSVKSDKEIIKAKMPSAPASPQRGKVSGKSAKKRVKKSAKKQEQEETLPPVVYRIDRAAPSFPEAPRSTFNRSKDKKKKHKNSSAVPPDAKRPSVASRSNQSYTAYSGPSDVLKTLRFDTGPKPFAGREFFETAKSTDISNLFAKENKPVDAIAVPPTNSPGNAQTYPPVTAATYPQATATGYPQAPATGYPQATTASCPPAIAASYAQAAQETYPPEDSTTNPQPAAAPYAEAVAQANPPQKEVEPLPNIRVFQPMLQVDHFAWPNVCHRLETVAAIELERMTEALLTLKHQGNTVIAVGGQHRGEGATTMLLCAARRLSSRNVKTVIVDADFSEPQLAKRLGLLPQLGWEDVIEGRQPVEEVLVESTSDNVVVLSVCNPFEILNLGAHAQQRMSASLATMREYFGLVLVDLGPLEDHQYIYSLSASGLCRSIDIAMLVHNVGKTPITAAAALQQSLASVGVRVAGIIENFVRNSDN